MVLATMILLALPATVRADEIWKKGSDRPISGTVVSENLQVVKYKRPRVQQTLEIPSDQVERIVYEDAPESFTQGLRFLESGDPENAVNSLRLALQEKQGGSWLEIHAHAHQCDVLGGD